jgi:hypothetical protein
MRFEHQRIRNVFVVKRVNTGMNIQESSKRYEQQKDDKLHLALMCKVLVLSSNIMLTASAPGTIPYAVSHGILQFCFRSPTKNGSGD